MPGVWPLNWFELVFGLYALCAAGLLGHPQLRDVLAPQLDALRARRTALALATSSCPTVTTRPRRWRSCIRPGTPSAPRCALRARRSFLCVSWQLQPSLSVVAHAAHVLRLLGEPAEPAYRYLLRRQQSDGRWLGDKWQSSWLYTTSQVIIALPYQPYCAPIDRAVDELVSYQSPDGGWGDYHGPTTEETAYGVLALRHLRRHSALHEEARLALGAAEHWMLDHYRPFRQAAPAVARQRRLPPAADRAHDRAGGDVARAACVACYRRWRGYAPSRAPQFGQKAALTGI
ncbi:MAG: hypothetical protein U0Z44_03205 [Kouleothrix sp.]